MNIKTRIFILSLATSLIASFGQAQDKPEKKRGDLFERQETLELRLAYDIGRMKMWRGYVTITCEKSENEQIS